MKFSRKSALVILTVAMCLLMTSCGSKSHSDYAAAYNKITSNGGLDASIVYSVKMDGKSTGGTGTLKIDSTHDTMYYEMNMDSGERIVEFTDGSYLYVDDGSEKHKYILSGSQSEDEPSLNEPKETPESDDAPEFDVEAFISEYASFMEVSKIQEMGLLNALPSAIVSKVQYSDGSYSLTVNTDAISKVLNAEDEDSTGTDTPSISNIKDFTYTAIEKDDIIVGLKISGSSDVKVPGSLMSDGKDAEYTLTFSIDITFNNPGQAVSFDLPSTSDYNG